jgi:hypothetical protein
MIHLETTDYFIGYCILGVALLLIFALLASYIQNS